MTDTSVTYSGPVWLLVREFPDPQKPGVTATEVVPWPFESAEQALAAAASNPGLRDEHWQAKQIGDTPWAPQEESVRFSLGQKKIWIAEAARLSAEEALKIKERAMSGK